MPDELNPPQWGGPAPLLAPEVTSGRESPARAPLASTSLASWPRTAPSKAADQDEQVRAGPFLDRPAPGEEAFQPSAWACRSNLRTRLPCHDYLHATAQRQPSSPCMPCPPTPFRQMAMTATDTLLRRSPQRSVRSPCDDRS